MVVPWWVIPGLAAVSTVVLSFWGWLALQVVSQGQKLIELEERISSGEHRCDERLVLIRAMNEKLDYVAGGVRDISGFMRGVHEKKEKDND
jgi:hypothetical protein